MPSFRTHALAILALLSFTSSVNAGLIQGPTGVEYVKRFVPSPGVNGCYYLCPAAAGSFVVLDEQGTEIQNGARTRCDYVVEGQTTPIQQSCTYASATGIKTNGPASCPATARQVCSIKKRRKLSKLEEEIRKRQYTYPKGGRVAQ